MPHQRRRSSCALQTLPAWGTASWPALPNHIIIIIVIKHFPAHVELGACRNLLNLAWCLMDLIQLVKSDSVQVCNGLSNDALLQANAAPRMGRFDNFCNAVQQVVGSQLRCKKVQQCTLGSTVLAPFERCNSVCQLGVTANTRKSRLTLRTRLRRAHVNGCASMV